MITRRTTLSLMGLGAAAAGYGLLRPSGLPALDLGSARAQDAGAIEDITLGDADAPVEVVEYASFTCPHCAAFHTSTFKDFRRDYIDTGKVRFTYREVYFDRYGLWASMVARCAGPMRYMGVADLIYRGQNDWARQSDPAAVADSLKKIGLQAGLSQEELDACLDDGAKAQALVKWFEANASRDEVTSTPSFLIDGEIHSGNMSLEQIGRLVDEAAAG